MSNNTLIKKDTQLFFQVNLKHNVLNEILTGITEKKIALLFKQDRIKAYSDYCTLLIGNFFSKGNKGWLSPTVNTVFDFTDKKLMDKIYYETIKVKISNLLMAHERDWKLSSKELLGNPVGFRTKDDALDESIIVDLKKLINNFETFVSYHKLRYLYPHELNGFEDKNTDPKKMKSECVAYNSLNPGSKFLLNSLKKRDNKNRFGEIKNEFGFPMLADGKDIHNKLQLYFKGIKNEKDFKERYLVRITENYSVKNYPWKKTIPELSQIMDLLRMRWSIFGGLEKDNLFYEFLTMVNIS